MSASDVTLRSRGRSMATALRGSRYLGGRFIKHVGFVFGKGCQTKCLYKLQFYEPIEDDNIVLLLRVLYRLPDVTKYAFVRNGP